MQIKKGSFLEKLYKMAQMDPMMMGGAPPAGPPMGGGMPPAVPMGGGMPLAGPMGAPGAGAGGGAMDPMALMSMMAPAAEEGLPPEEGGEPVPEEAPPAQVSEETVQKALDLADKAIDLAESKDLSGDKMTSEAAGAITGSGAVDGLSPQDILALREGNES